MINVSVFVQLREGNKQSWCGILKCSLCVGVHDVKKYELISIMCINKMAERQLFNFGNCIQAVKQEAPVCLVEVNVRDVRVEGH